MSDKRMESVVIVGGGTAGWMAAAGLIEKFGASGYTKITLIESEQIGTVGVGEATVPAILEFLKMLQINEVDFIKKTNATFKLAIGFEGWAGKDSLFFHPFAEHGVTIAGQTFLDIWTRLHQAGVKTDIDDYCLASQLAKASKFALPRLGERSQAPLFNYAFHFDASLVARYLQRWARAAGVRREEGIVQQVTQDPETGFVTSVTLDDGRAIEGDLFIDCSGFRGLLTEQTLGTGFESWSHWLPCDRAITAPSPAPSEPASYTLSSARQAGWQWKIPLQNRTGNGYVYCSAYQSEDEAARSFIDSFDTELSADPNPLKFSTGIRKKLWNKNVFCLGLASGFLEPLESTSIYLIQSALLSLLNNFPTKEHNQILQDESNRRNYEHWVHIRDFIILHYALNQRTGESFWDDCRSMDLPDSLKDTIALYRATGRVRKDHTEFFQKSSWVSLFSGFGVVPEYYHPSTEDIPRELLIKELSNLKAGIEDAVKNAPPHHAFIAKNCPAPSAVSTP